jgi:hypothetical protein
MATVAVVTDPAYGAQGGAKLVDDAAIDTAVDATKLISTAAAFATGDIGKSVVVAGAGASGAPLKTTIASVSGGVATLAAAATTTVAGAQAVYGHDDTAAFLAAHNSGLPVEVPEGAYLCVGMITPDGTTKGIRFRGEDPGRTTVYHPSDTLLARASGSWASPISLTLNVTAGDTTLTMSSTSTLRRGDYLRLGSNAQWSANAGSTKKGEVVRIASVDSGTVVSLATAAIDGYLTADSAQVWKANYNAGHRLEGITFWNASPDYGSGGGVDFRQCADGEVANCIFQYGVGSQVRIYESRDFAVRGSEFRDGYAVSATAGVALCYGVSVIGCTVNSHVFDSKVLRGHGVFTTSAGATDFGVPRYCSVVDCFAFNFYNQPFHTHEQGEFIYFVDCVAVAGSPVNSGGFVPGFGLYARRSELIGPVVENSYGEAITINAAADGALVRGAVVRRQQRGTNQACGMKVGAPNCTIVDAYIDGVTDSNASNTDNVSGSGIVILAGATNCQVIRGVVKDTSGSAVSHFDSTDSAVIDDLIGIDNDRYVVWANQDPVLPNWRSIRTINSGLGTTNKPAGLMSHFPQRAQGLVAPGWGGDMGIAGTPFPLIAGRMYLARFVAPRDFAAAAVAFWIAVAAGANDAVDVALMDASFNRLASAGGGVTGKLNGATNVTQSVSLSAPVMVRQGVTYYLALAVAATFGGTAASLRGPNLANPQGEVFGTAGGVRDMGVVTGVGATIGAGPYAPVMATTPYLEAVAA